MTQNPCRTASQPRGFRGPDGVLRLIAPLLVREGRAGPGVVRTGVAVLHIRAEDAGAVPVSAVGTGDRSPARLRRIPVAQGRFCPVSPSGLVGVAVSARNRLTEGIAG